MSFAPGANRLVATVLAMAMLVGAVDVAPAGAGCNDACPCCQARKAAGESSGCCHSQHADKGGCCHKRNSTAPAMKSCCAKRHTAQQSAAHVAAPPVDGQASSPLCLCGASQHEPVLPAAWSVRAPDLKSLALDTLSEQVCVAPVLAREAFSPSNHHPGSETALAMRAVLCCWRI